MVQRVHIDILYSATDFTFSINMGLQDEASLGVINWMLGEDIFFSSLRLKTLNLITYLELNRDLRSPYFCNTKQGKQGVILHCVTYLNVQYIASCALHNMRRYSIP
jgi:hypothetical protein